MSRGVLDVRYLCHSTAKRLTGNVNALCEKTVVVMIPLMILRG
jgi:hypothetical protein